MKTAPAKKVKKVVAKKASVRRKIVSHPAKLVDVLSDSDDYYAAAPATTTRRGISGHAIPTGAWIEGEPGATEFTVKWVPRKVAYTCGPMRNILDFNFPAFHAAAKHLREVVGIDVLSPAEHDESQGFDPSLNSLEGFDLKAAMKWDLGCVLKADMVIALPGWEASSGCAVEISMAREIGTPVLAYPSLEPVQEESICAEADRLVGGARRSTYGHPWENFESTAALWAPIIGTMLTPEQVSMCLIQLKISRLLNSPDHRDSVVDIAGYAKTYDLVRQRRAEMAVA